MRGKIERLQRLDHPLPRFSALRHRSNLVRPRAGAQEGFAAAAGKPRCGFPQTAHLPIRHARALFAAIHSRRFQIDPARASIQNAAWPTLGRIAAATGAGKLSQRLPGSGRGLQRSVRRTRFPMRLLDGNPGQLHCPIGGRIDHAPGLTIKSNGLAMHPQRGCPGRRLAPRAMSV